VKWNGRTWKVVSSVPGGAGESAWLYELVNPNDEFDKPDGWVGEGRLEAA
jgi:hypothetical protein